MPSHSSNQESIEKDAGESAAVPTSARGAVSFPIVGIGASAGEIEAFQELLVHAPRDSGLALVQVQHFQS